MRAAAPSVGRRGCFEDEDDFDRSANYIRAVWMPIVEYIAGTAAHAGGRLPEW